MMGERWLFVGLTVGRDGREMVWFVTRRLSTSEFAKRFFGMR
jgi:hypothetical protein